MNSIAYSIGGSKPPSPCKSTLGSPAQLIGWVFGEDEDMLPRGWEPFHVDRGYRRTDSVVTVMCIYPPVENIDHASVTPQEHVNWWVHLVSGLTSVGGPAVPKQMEAPHIIGMGPEHAQMVAGAGWTKDDFRKAFWEKVRIPLSAWPKGNPGFEAVSKMLGQRLTPETLIPITLKPDLFYIVIAGGTGKHSHYFPPFPGCLPVSKLVEK